MIQSFEKRKKIPIGKQHTKTKQLPTAFTNIHRNVWLTRVWLTAGITSVHHLLRGQAKGSLGWHVLSATVYVCYFVSIISFCMHWQACSASLLYFADKRRVGHGLCVNQDPCAGSQRRIKVTGATVSCGCCSKRTHRAPQTLMLQRGGEEDEGNRRFC